MPLAFVRSSSFVSGFGSAFQVTRECSQCNSTRLQLRSGERETVFYLLFLVQRVVAIIERTVREMRERERKSLDEGKSARKKLLQQIGSYWWTRVVVDDRLLTARVEACVSDSIEDSCDSEGRSVLPIDIGERRQ